MRAAEWRALRELRLAALADAPTAFATTLEEAEARTDEQWRTFVASAASGTSSATFVVVGQGAFVGMASGFEPPDDPGFVHLVQMWTGPSVRRRGLGRRLVDEVLAFAADRPVRLSVMHDNTGATLLYRSFGFVEDPDPWPGFDPCPDELHLVRWH